MNEYIKQLDVERRIGKSVDLGKLCRLCVSHLSLLPLFDGDGMKYELVKKIRRHLSIQVKNVEGMSPHICYKCAWMLMDWDAFVSTSLIADARLRHCVTAPITCQENTSVTECPTYSPFNYPEHVSQVNNNRNITTTHAVFVDESFKPEEPEDVGMSEVNPFEAKSTIALQEMTHSYAIAQEAANELIKFEEIATSEEVIVSYEETTQANTLENINIEHRNCEVSNNCKGDLTKNLGADVAEKVYDQAENLKKKYLKDNLDPLIIDTNKESNLLNVGSNFNNPIGEITFSGINPLKINVDSLIIDKNKHSSQVNTGSNLNIEDMQSFFKSNVLKSLVFTEDGRIEFSHISSVPSIQSNDDKIDHNFDKNQLLERRTAFHGLKLKSQLISKTIEWSLHGKQWSCLKCQIKYTSPHDWHLHLKSNHAMKVYVCDNCGNLYRKKSGLKTHMQKHFNDVAKPKVVSTKRQKEIPCLKCEIRCCSVRTLKDHCKKYHATKDQTCEYCGAFYQNKKYLDVHLRKHTGATPHKCNTCNEAFSYKTSLIKHEKVHKSIVPIKHLSLTCETCGKKCLNQSMIRNHLRTHLPKNILCASCGKVFQTKNNLRQHIKYVHTDARPFLCTAPNCNKTFKTWTKLRDHVVGHNGERNFVCELCGKSFHTMDNLRQHKLIHSGDKPHKCDLCSAMYNRRGNLTMHRKKHDPFYTHKIIRPNTSLQCIICNQFVKSENGFKLHMAKHTGETEPFACQTCDMKFKIPLALKIHERLHTGETPFGCDKCDKSFRSRASLIQHLNIHFDIFPHECPFCDRAFKRITSLSIHKRSHTGEKNHKCPTCGRAFSQKGDMKKHRFTHDKVKTKKQKSNKIIEYE